MDERDEGASAFHDEHGGGDTQAHGSEIASDASMEPPITAMDTAILEPPPIPAFAQSPTSADRRTPFSELEGNASGNNAVPLGPSTPGETPETTSWAARVNAAFDALDSYDLLTDPGLNIASAGASAQSVDEVSASSAPQVGRGARQRGGFRARARAVGDAA